MQSNTYLILLLVHLVSDFMFQPTKWAVTKQKNQKNRALHSLQYAIIFLPVLFLLKINLLWFFYLFATHFIIDSYTVVKKINKIKSFGFKYKQPIWFETMQDQILHFLLLLPLA